MQINEVSFNGQPPVDSYGPGFFRVSNIIHKGALFLTLKGSINWTGLDDLTAIIENKDDYDVVFIGMGKEISPLPKTIYNKLEKAGVPFEVMNSPSACRTYNVLLSEERRVGLAVLPI
tara:strand:+ start:653 stop:1006 length:354 start_codon:yes stop_codon:yes gene_type:complete